MIKVQLLPVITYLADWLLHIKFMLCCNSGWWMERQDSGEEQQHQFSPYFVLAVRSDTPWTEGFCTGARKLAIETCTSHGTLNQGEE